MRNESDAAAEHLKVIRHLMERATVYRTISGPTALFGGVLAVVVAGSMAWAWRRAGWDAGALEFLVIWIGVLGLATGFNFALVFRGAGRRGEPFVSAGMRMALRTIAPPMFVGGVLGASLAVSAPGPGPVYAAVVWVLCYGLALCATAGFAPRSIGVLGTGFLVAGTALVAAWHFYPPLAAAPPGLAASAVMGATFGALHLVYALCVGLRDRDRDRDQPATSPTGSGEQDPA